MEWRDKRKRKGRSWLALAGVLLGLGLPESRADSVEPPGRVLPGPSLERWYEGRREEAQEEPRPGAEGGKLVLQGARGKVALATELSSPIFDSVGRGRAVIGGARRGNTLRVLRRAGKSRCYESPKRGRWYELEGGGYVCDARSFRVTLPPVEPVDQLQPDLSEVLPYRYARVSNKGAPRLSRLPTAREARLLDQRHARVRPVVERMAGDYFVALGEVEDVAGERFYRTARQHYVREKDLEILVPPAMHGERLGEEGHRLPLAFVYGGDAPLHCREGGAWKVCGVARKHARFEALETFEHGGRQLVRGEGDVAVEAHSLRMARRVERPAEVPAGEKWLHVDLSEQTLVAYEGDTPVYATLVSTGRKGFTTPTGLYRTTRKWLTRTMRGRDPVDGIYDVEEVPWVMYYLRGYAVHGAYWHDDFGKVRSHGCTNVAPIDMRWLYEWSSLRVPEGWHGTNEGPGTWMYFTR
ncbi:L,D-transpeptidase [Archangium violaceum]|uniref:L,D-transpeptidase n=1 Tax=Archangium violaceum TaxID=83451 RepID=UPI00193B3ED6|nr:L,D-transpeptidase [Archangium violaceum]QRK10905.1 L,D-transpeptidase [Archangium violaceum]